ncbi:hypothetical protein BX600DRAFT_89493 [Xylariales sp. PMI_506]|nr:hypothetical protein BX600DRAFT_89493 [Xylariales sp. PMI_506]
MEASWQGLLPRLPSVSSELGISVVPVDSASGETLCSCSRHCLRNFNDSSELESSLPSLVNGVYHHGCRGRKLKREEKKVDMSSFFFPPLRTRTAFTRPGRHTRHTVFAIPAKGSPPLHVRQYGVAGHIPTSPSRHHEPGVDSEGGEKKKRIQSPVYTEIVCQPRNAIDKWEGAWAESSLLLGSLLPCASCV